jgi:transcriptional regulator NrdR family protein
MNCPKCDAATHVLDTRQKTKRRRECLSCGHRFSTVEVVVADEVAPRVAAPEPKPEPKAKAERRPTPAKQKAIARMNARREIERRRDGAGFSDWYSQDNDYLPEV